MGKPGPETKLVAKMREAAREKYGSRLVQTKYHGNAYSQSGVSDMLDCLDGVFVAIEAKAPENYDGSVEKALTKGPTVLQRKYVADVLAAGGVAGFAATVEQYMDILDCAAGENPQFCGGAVCLGHNV